MEICEMHVSVLLANKRVDWKNFPVTRQAIEIFRTCNGTALK